MKLVFGVHDHQPVGNFGWVIEEIYNKSYAPFLDVVERHPDFRFCLHVTGPLFEWIDEQRPEWLDRVRALVEAGRVELLGGGYYEPILAAIPESDRIGQIHLMRQRMHERLGASPRGVWMAERVWEPHLAGSLARAGVEFALLDDFHFVQAGIAPERLERGALRTDDLGDEVALLPIDERLRYLIPFADPARTVELCREVHERDPDGVLVMVDDGEKFGAWPGTGELVYGKQWLDRFIVALTSESDWLELAHPSEVLDARPPRERVYLPPNSYFEMSEWSLPMPAAEQFEKLVADFKSDGRWNEMRPFLRGGFWRQFFQKYEESLLMHRRALLLHDEIARAAAAGADVDRLDEARDHLWRAECNCAYWHGVFGGLTLPHLRHAVWRHLILGTQILQSVAPVPAVSRVTMTGGQGRDIRLSGQAHEVFLSPERGGAVVSFEDRAEDWNLLNTLRRRREAYHARIEAAPLPGETAEKGDGASIHDIQWEVTPEIKAALAVDPQHRYALRDRLLHRDADFGSVLDDMSGADGGDLVEQAAEVTEVGEQGVTMTLAGRYRGRDGCTIPVTLTKKVTLESDGLTVHRTLRNEGDTELVCRLGCEWNVALYDAETFLEGGDGPLDAAQLSASSGISIRVPLHHVRLAWTHDSPAAAWIHPVRTATQGEDGFHLTYQGHMLLFLHDVVLNPGEQMTTTQTLTLTHGVDG